MACLPLSQLITITEKYIAGFSDNSKYCKSLIGAINSYEENLQGLIDFITDLKAQHFHSYYDLIYWSSSYFYNFAIHTFLVHVEISPDDFEDFCRRCTNCTPTLQGNIEWQSFLILMFIIRESHIVYQETSEPMIHIFCRCKLTSIFDVLSEFVDFKLLTHNDLARKDKYGRYPLTYFDPSQVPDILMVVPWRSEIHPWFKNHLQLENAFMLLDPYLPLEIIEQIFSYL